MGSFLSATFHLADSEVFSEEMKDIILSENFGKSGPRVGFAFAWRQKE